MQESTQPILRNATRTGTAELAEHAVAQLGRHPSAYRKLGRTGLTVSALGFGCYRVHDQVEDHVAALGQALGSGVNLIDTATNYGDGHGELLVGRVMARGEFRRDGVVIVSKAGYLQGAALRDAVEREHRHAGWSEVVRYSEGCWHCLHPDFLSHELTRSLERTSQTKLDVYLLHNPEYFLLDLERRRDRRPLEARRDEMYARIGRAFVALEAEVTRGRLGWYGVSSNALGAPPTAAEALALDRLVALAESVVGKSHHFGVVQLPLNLLEGGAATALTNGPGLDRTTLDTARRAELGVLANRPLNAFRRGRLVRLVDFALQLPASDPGDRDRPERAFRAVERLEAEFAQAFVPAILGETGQEIGELRYATFLQSKADTLHDLVLWNDFVRDSFAPEISERCQLIEEALTGPLKAAWQIWVGRYAEALQRQLETLRTVCARGSQRVVERLARSVPGGVGGEHRAASMASRSIATMASIPGVTSVLVGMRQPSYVTDVTTVLGWAPVAGGFEAITALSDFDPAA